MEFKLKEKVTTKLFAGCLVDPGMRHLLDRSKVWKQAKLHPEQELILIPYQGKEYLGTYINTIGITIEKLKLIDEEVRRKVMSYIPKHNPKLLQLSIFSQVFIQ